MLVVLGLIDVVMISNLLIMVIVGGYETFVSRMRLEGHPDQPEWLSHVNASVLKVKLATAIIGISSIHLLKTFINAAGVHREDAVLPDGDPHHVPALRARDRRRRPAHAAAGAAAPQRTEKQPSLPEDCNDRIRQQDLIQSVADALQFISYYHPVDYIRRSARPTTREQSPAAKDAIAQILTNSRMCAEGHRPICQDTGIVVAFVKVGMDVQLGRRHDVADRHDQRGRAPRLHRPGQPPARVDPRRPARQAQEHERQHAGRRALRARAGQHRRGQHRGEGRRLGEQVEVRDAQPVRLDRRLGAEDRADDGRRLVPAGHARHRHRRHAPRRRCCSPRKR